MLPHSHIINGHPLHHSGKYQEKPERIKTMTTDIQELRRQIGDPKMPAEGLRQTLELINAQLARYRQAKQLLDEGVNNEWTYDAYAEAMRITNPEAGLGSRENWDKMNVFGRYDVRKSVVLAVEEGLALFETLQQAAEAALAKKENKKGFWPFKK
jgi:hypothetical protein